MIKSLDELIKAKKRSKEASLRLTAEQNERYDRITALELALLTGEKLTIGELSELEQLKSQRSPEELGLEEAIRAEVSLY